MFPTPLQIGTFQFTSFGLCLALGFVFSAFIVWKSARDRGLEDDKVLDLLVVVSAISLIGARIGFVISHLSLFSPQLLRLFVIWRFPGLSLWGALGAGFVAFILMNKKLKLPLSIMFDSFGRSFPVLLFFLSLAAFLDGSLVGKETDLPWAMPAVGAAGLRHPVGIYGIILSVFFAGALLGLSALRRKKDHKIPGTIGWSSFFLLGVMLLLLAIVRADLLYLGGVAVEIALSVVVIFTTLLPTAFILGGDKGREMWLSLEERIKKKITI